MIVALIICVSTVLGWYWARRVHLLIFRPEQFAKALANDTLNCRHLPGSYRSPPAAIYNLLGMFDWLRKKDAPLTGAPAVRRQKTHSAESGYVYQYFYEGQRPAERDGVEGTQYVFNVSGDRKSAFPVSVFVGEAALAEWQRGHGRALGSTERYAVAKLALFQAFDRRQTPAAMNEEVHVQPEDVEQFLASLDIS